MLVSKPLLKMFGKPSNLLHGAYTQKQVVRKYDFSSSFCLILHMSMCFSFELWPLDIQKLTSCIKMLIEPRKCPNFRMPEVFVHCNELKKARPNETTTSGSSSNKAHVPSRNHDPSCDAPFCDRHVSKLISNKPVTFTTTSWPCQKSCRLLSCTLEHFSFF